MKLRFLVVAFVSTLTSIAAHAQGAIYFSAPVYNHIGNSVADTGPFAFLGSGSTSQSFYGVGFGGYYQVPVTGKLNAGIDIRDTVVHGNNAGLNSFLVGARVSGKPFARPIKPYAEVAVGVGTSRAPQGAVKVTKVEYGIYGGADYVLAKHIDWRVLEIGFGSLNTVSSETVGGTSTIPASKIISASTGLVFRF